MPSQTYESSLLTCFGCLQPWMVGATSTLVVAAAIAPVHAASLTSWSFDPTANHLEVVVSDRTTPRYFLMAQPARIVLELPNTSVGAVKAQNTYTGSVRQIRVSQFQPGLTRIVMELAPGTSLAPGQVQLQQVSGDKWRLRPLIAQSTAAAPPTPATPSISRRDPSPPAPTAIVPSPAPASVNANLPSPPPLPVAPSPPAPASSSETPLPPSTPPADSNSGDVTIAVPPLVPSSVPPAQASAAPPATNATPRPTPSQQPVTAAVPTPLPPAAAIEASPVELPSALPQSSSGSPAVRVSVPPLGAKSPASAPPIVGVGSSPPPSALIVTPSISAPARQPDASSLPIVGVPSSASGAPAPTGSAVERGQSFAAPQPSSIVEFGQPLPTSQPTAPGTVLPAGTLLNLRYPGRDSLSLRTDSPHQEVLLLESEIRDAIGNLVFPQGSQVVGRFETNSTGSRFVAQAISVQGRNLPLNAQSGELTGNRRVSDDKLARNSGIGAIAGGLVGGFSGLGIVGGAAAGAAATFFTAPKPATIQPGQVVQVRLLQDLR
ncbi:AMIN domain-containing protein [Leptolyngbya sp. FACHB-36]|uniref:AMIN domain-containing protein n=1 Tax=Leptolyngbya sp. FACHB-36 TaxID=2692808 RepID=UPI0016808DA8|nr:AMIN domain-containing protein [Leptolyngbya sp. FACHB-36]MBD2022243.1 AMIN domain-containing protein [Leptolyngbya sp. FACHB-36]